MYDKSELVYDVLVSLLCVNAVYYCVTLKLNVIIMVLELIFPKKYYVFSIFGVLSYIM